MWEYIGRNWFRNGLTPYAGGVDNKSPLIYVLFGLSDKLFGVNYFFPRIVGTFCQSLGIFFVYKIAKHLTNKQAGVLSVTVYGLSLLWKSTDGIDVSLTQTYAVTFIIISFYCSITALKGKDFFIAGLIAGLGFGFRFSAGFGIAAIGIFVLRKNVGFGVLFFTGVITIIFVQTILLHLAGISFSDFLTYAFTDNFGSDSITDRNFSWRAASFVHGFFYSELVLFYPFIIAYFFINKKIDLLSTWLICEFIGINILSMYATAHFKNLLPAFSLMSGIAISYLVQTYKVPLKPTILIIWITFFPKILDPLVGLKKLILPVSLNSEKYCEPPFQQDDFAEKELGLWIKTNTTEQQKVFIAGHGAEAQAYSERQSPTIYFNITPTKIAQERLFQDLSTNHPFMIAVPLFPEYNQYVNENIRSFINDLVAKNYVFKTCMYGYNIYMLKK